MVQLGEDCCTDTRLRLRASTASSYLLLPFPLYVAGYLSHSVVVHTQGTHSWSVVLLNGMEPLERSVNVASKHNWPVLMQVAGKRYNPNSGVISISCDRRRAREDNRRQALHWALRLVETALLEHPSEEWERIKDLQQEALIDVDKPAPCPFASFIEDGADDDQPLGSEKPTSAQPVA